MTKTIVIILIVVLYVALPGSSAATVRTKEFVEKLDSVMKENIYEDPKRAAELKANDCYATPCGWYLHNSATFMPNTCSCPDDTYKCLRTGEDLSKNAFVYHCRRTK